MKIDKRYCGPRAMANGGYAAGLFASVIHGPAEVTLKAPARFDVKIAFDPDEEEYGRFRVFAGEAEIAAVRPGAVEIDPPPLPPDDAIAAGRAAYIRDEGMTLVYPYCFVCGKRRMEGDGLRIFAGPASDSAVNADFWTPADNLAGEDGLVRAEYLWAALDCPGAFTLRLGAQPVLLGRFTAEIKRRPAPGENLLVAAWKTGAEGRKHFSSSALYDEDRAVIAAANAVWIEINDPALVERLAQENA
ncbi:MAG: hypothetical protein ACE5FO_13230 [Parvularculaceae bacterium]